MFSLLFSFQAACSTAGSRDQRVPTEISRVEVSRSPAQWVSLPLLIEIQLSGPDDVVMRGFQSRWKGVVVAILTSCTYLLYSGPTGTSFPGRIVPPFNTIRYLYLSSY